MRSESAKTLWRTFTINNLTQLRRFLVATKKAAKKVSKKRKITVSGKRETTRLPKSSSRSKPKKGKNMTTAAGKAAYGANDYISVAAVGVNGHKKNSIVGRFNGLGQAIDKNGVLVTGEVGLNMGSVSVGAGVPTFPQAAYTDAVSSGDMDRAQEIAEEFSAALAAAKASGAAKSTQTGLLDAVCQWLEGVHGWSQKDGNHFVYKREGFAMQEKTLTNGSRFISVTQQATFGL